MRFANCFEGIYSRSISFANLHYFAERSFADDFEEIERIDCERLVLVRLIRNANAEGAGSSR